MATRSAQSGVEESKLALTFLQKFVNSCGTESEEREDAEGTRFVLTTSTVEDYLFRGDHPILAPMSLQVYCMWAYRIEKPRSAARKRREVGSSS